MNIPYFLQWNFALCLSDWEVNIKYIYFGSFCLQPFFGTAMYSPVSKYSPEARKRMTYRTKGKSCGYYMRIVFFFSSLIQSLIIVSLVLFLVYGKQQDSASVARIQDLEKSFSRLSIENVDLRLQRKNLTNLLNVTLMEKARNDWDLAWLKYNTNISFYILQDTDKKLQQCTMEKRLCQLQGGSRGCPPPVPIGGGCNCGLEFERLKAKIHFVESNFTQTAMKMQMEMDQISKDRDSLNLEAIHLRRNKSMHEKEIQFYQIKCKEDFVQSLSGISNVSRKFLQKIDSLFPAHLSFQLTCVKQREHLEQIRTNCTNLSQEVEDRFQRYLDNVGDKVSAIQGKNSRLTAENWRMAEDYRWCSQNRTGLIKEHKQNLEKIQQKNDVEKEKLLNDKLKLYGDITVLESSIKLKNKEVEHLNEKVKQLNGTCMPWIGFGGLVPGASPARSGTQPGSNCGPNTGASNCGSAGGNQFGQTGFGGSTSRSSSNGSPFGSVGSNPNLGSTGSGFNKPASTGLGSSNFGSPFGSTVSNPGLGSSGLNKQASSGQGSSFGSTGSNPSLGSPELGLNKPASPFGSPFGSSASNNPSSSGASSSKFGATGASSSGLGSSLGSSGSSSSKPSTNSRGLPFFGSSSSSGSSISSGSSGNSGSSSSSLGSSRLSTSGRSSASGSSSSGSSATTGKASFGSWFGLGGGSSSSSSSSTNSEQSKQGSNQGRGSTTGNSFGSVGSGRSSTFTGAVSVNQHLQNLQRIINPPVPEEKQELSRMMG